MVLPEGADPLAFHWPVKDLPVLLIEVGTFDTARLERLAYALLRDGAAFVRPLREALLAKTPPESWPTYCQDHYRAA
ncbi:MAG: hypothetical protein JNM50_13770 [Chromatiales bacterium]|nr:hypothetical protein [Chromatiales bacterium]